MNQFVVGGKIVAFEIKSIEIGTSLTISVAVKRGNECPSVSLKKEFNGDLRQVASETLLEAIQTFCKVDYFCVEEFWHVIVNDNLGKKISCHEREIAQKSFFAQHPA